MNQDIIKIIVGMAALVINGMTMMLIFPCKRSLRFAISAFTIFTVVFYTILGVTGLIVPDNGGLPGLVYLPVVILLFEGKLFQKVFAYFFAFIATAFRTVLAEAVGGIFLPYGENTAFMITLAVQLIIIAAYMYGIFKYGRLIFEKIFLHGRSEEWALYSFGAMFSFAVLTTMQIAPNSVWHAVLLLFFILWSFIVLCMAIINTHEKSKQAYDAAFARDIISSGLDHYQKMNEMYDTLRIMRHDYKYHLNTVGELLNSGDRNEAEKYLADIQKQLSENEFVSYCSNPVLNALLTVYSERCARFSIKYDTNISIPAAIAVPNYELCIVLGNLLENAVEACCRKDGVRKIELVMNTQGTHLAVMVKNSFNGGLAEGEGRLSSTKKDGGLGLRSVQAVAARHGGELMTEWDQETFSAYVLIRM